MEDRAEEGCNSNCKHTTNSSGDRAESRVVLVTVTSIVVAGAGVTGLFRGSTNCGKGQGRNLYARLRHPKPNLGCCSKGFMFRVRRGGFVLQTVREADCSESLPRMASSSTSENCFLSSQSKRRQQRAVATGSGCKQAGSRCRCTWSLRERVRCGRVRLMIALRLPALQAKVPSIKARWRRGAATAAGEQIEGAVEVSAASACSTHIL